MCALKYDMESNEVYETPPTISERISNPLTMPICVCLAVIAAVFLILSWIGDKNVKPTKPPQTESLWP